MQPFEPFWHLRRKQQHLEQIYTIAEILSGCQQGDRKAQESLYRLFASKMLSVCLRYASCGEEAEDMLQNGFVKVFHQIAYFRGEGSFEGWIRRIMVNSAIEVVRKNKRGFQTVAIENVYEGEHASFDLEGLEVQDLLKLIQELPDGYRMVFNLYAIEGYTHREIAETLRISEGASKSQLSRARTWLKNKLDKIEKGGYYGTCAG